MMSSKKIIILIIVIGISVGIGYVLVSGGPEHLSQSPSQEEPIGRLVYAKSIECGNEEYVFEVAVSEELGYFTNVYKDTNSPENFVTALKYQKGTSAYYHYSPISAYQMDCNIIYLTKAFPGDGPLLGIYEWQIDTNLIRELAISSELYSQYYPHFRNTKPRLPSVSPDGNRILIAIPNRGLDERDYCHYKTLKLLDFREDRSVELVRLSENEDFVDGLSDLSPYCQGLSFAWLDDSTIYYDVYDATPGLVAYPTPRPVIERRTLLTQ